MKLVFIFVLILLNGHLSEEVQYFNNITLRVHRNGTWTKLIDENNVENNHEYFTTDIIIEGYSSTVPIDIVKTGSFYNLTYLQYLILRDNGIKTIQPESFKILPNLKIINLNLNRIENITSGIFQHLHLTRLYLSGNSIKNIWDDAFSDLPYLEVLDLSKNQIGHFSKNIFNNVTNIREINLSFNKLKALSDRIFKQIFNNNILYDKNIIDFSYNFIERIHPNAFEGLVKIYDLLLNNNQLRDIDQIHLKNVIITNSVNLEGNYIRELHPKLLNKILTYTKELNLIRNPLNCIFVRKVVMLSEKMDKTVYIDTDSC